MGLKTPIVKLNLHFKAKSSLCDSIDRYIHFKGTITVPNSGTATNPNNRHMTVILKVPKQIVRFVNRKNCLQIRRVKSVI